MSKDDTLPLPRRNMMFRPGCEVFGYRIVKPISESMRSTVFLAEKGGAVFALKVYHKPFERTEHEKTTITHIAHKGLPRVFEYLEADAHTVEISEYIDGQATGTIRNADIDQFVSELDSALLCLHCSGLIHNGIKPSNIFMTEAGYRLMDYGSVCCIGDKGRIGFKTDIRYRAPETTGSVISTASDMWSLGKTIEAVSTDGQGRTAQIVGGLTIKDPEKRWSHRQIRAWLTGKEIPEVLGPMEWPEPVCIGQAKAYNRLELAKAVSLQWDAAAGMLKIGALRSELCKRSLMRQIQTLDRKLQEDAALFCLVVSLSGRPVYRGKPLEKASDLRKIIEEAIVSGDTKGCQDLIGCPELTGLLSDKALAGKLHKITNKSASPANAYYILGGRKLITGGHKFGSLDDILDYAGKCAEPAGFCSAVFASGMLPGFLACAGYKKQAKAAAKLKSAGMDKRLPAEAIKFLLVAESCGYAHESVRIAAGILSRLVPLGFEYRISEFGAADSAGSKFILACRSAAQKAKNMDGMSVSGMTEAVLTIIKMSKKLDAVSNMTQTDGLWHIYSTAHSAAIKKRIRAKIAEHVVRIASGGSPYALEPCAGLPDDVEELLKVLYRLKNIKDTGEKRVTNITAGNALRVFSEQMVTDLPVPGSGRLTGSPDELFPDLLYSIQAAEYDKWKAEDLEVRDRRQKRNQARRRSWGSGFKTAGWVIGGICLGAVGIAVVLIMLILSAL